MCMLCDYEDAYGCDLDYEFDSDFEYVPLTWDDDPLDWDTYESWIFDQEDALEAAEWDAYIEELRSIPEYAFEPDYHVPSLDGMITSNQAFKAKLGNQEVV